MILNLLITLGFLHLKTQIRIYIINMNTTVFNNTTTYYHKQLKEIDVRRKENLLKKKKLKLGLLAETWLFIVV